VIRIYHTSDLHDHRGIAPQIRRLRQSDPGLYVDCGDSLRGSQTVFFRREPIVEELDAAGCDLQAVGNREFNYVFSFVRRRAALMHHPLVCSNLIDLRGRELPFKRDYTIEQADDGRMHRLRFCALLVPQYPGGSPWERIFGWRFLDPYDVVADFAATLRDEETLIVLSHLGLRADRSLARRVPRIDLLLGGHSHDTTLQPQRIGDVPVVHAGPYGRFVSRSELVAQSREGRLRLAGFALVPLLAA
jgi:2',3'-cyclic-nucleotide 2'-phosphodiesterase (5'-nucleotidase family)